MVGFSIYSHIQVCYTVDILHNVWQMHKLFYYYINDSTFLKMAKLGEYFVSYMYRLSALQQVSCKSQTMFPTWSITGYLR